MVAHSVLLAAFRAAVCRHAVSVKREEVQDSLLVAVLVVVVVDSWWLLRAEAEGFKTSACLTHIYI